MVLNASGKGKERAYESLTPALAGVRLADGEVEDKGPITQRRRGRKRRGKGNAPLNDGHINGLGGEPPDLLLGTTTGERRPGRGGPEKVQVNGNAPGRGQARGRGRGRGRANGHEGVLKSGLHPSAPVFEPVRDVSSNGQSHHVPSQKSAPGSKSISSPSITATPEIEAINPASGPSASRPEPVKLEETVLSLKHLAPLELELQLPPTYPLHAPPRVLSMHAPWLDAYQPAPLHELETLQSEACIKEWIEKRLAGLWDEMRAEILYIWGEFVSEGIWGDEDVGEFLLRAEKGAGEEGNTDVDFLLCEREEGMLHWRKGNGFAFLSRRPTHLTSVPFRATPVFIDRLAAPPNATRRIRRHSSPCRFRR